MKSIHKIKRRDSVNKNKELVICVYDEDAPTINEKILEAFERYLKSRLQNIKS